MASGAAAEFNLARIAVDFPEIAHKPGVPGDPRVVKYEFKIAEGMRLRLTRNMDKEAGFTNGTTGTVDMVLHKWAFVLRVDSGNKLLIYPLFNNGKPFLPCSYAYACTIRRAQGANMKLIALRFDHWHVDPGYAYVATSRATTRAGVYHVGPLRKKDWVPVGAPEARDQEDSEDDEEDDNYRCQESSESESDRRGDSDDEHEPQEEADFFEATNHQPGSDSEDRRADEEDVDLDNILRPEITLDDFFDFD